MYQKDTNLTKREMIGKTISHYKILEKLGEGGMGVVYKAHDTKLDRLIALKFLPKNLLCDEEAKTRFVHEAKAASALDHQNITTVYEIDEIEGECFISMAYVEGKSIKELNKEKRFSIEEILKIAIQICEGLDVAHEKGIVHRDIKSDNLMLTPRGQVKIMDFGLAKLKGATKVTKTGSTLGTVHYMSPEQAQGIETDHRSDIFSLGVVLYEMITGQLPFKGEHEAAIIYSIIYETPEPMINFNSNIPKGLIYIINKALEKKRELRYQNMSDLLIDLKKLAKGEKVKPIVSRRINSTNLSIRFGVVALLFLILLLSFWFFRGGPRVSNTPSLAVFYLENLGDKADNYFANGMTEELIADLSKLGGLRALSRSDVASYKDKEINIKELGKKLRVDYVILGAVQKADRILRMNAELIRTKDSSQVWAQEFTADQNSVFEIQDEMVKKIASELKVKLSPVEKKRIEKKPTGNVLAYDFYLRGMDYFWKGSERDLDLALEMFNNALEIDSNYALAYSGMGEVYATKYNYQRTMDWLDKAEEMAKRALDLDPELAEAHLTLGRTYDFKKEGALAMREFEKVIELLPNNNDAYRRLGWVFIYDFSNYYKGIENFKKALEIRPTDSKSYRGLGLAYTSLTRIDDAIKIIKKGLEMVPDDLYLLTFLADAYRYKGRFDLALGVYEKALKYYPNDPNVSFFLGGWVYYSKKEYDKAIQLFGKSIKQGMPEFRVLGYIGSAYRNIGDQEKAKVFYDSSVYACQMILEKEPENSWALSELGLTYALLGKEKEAIEKGEQAMKTEMRADQIYNLALIYAILKKYNLAVKTLEEVWELDPSYLLIAFSDPNFENLKYSRKFERLLKKEW